MAWEWEQNGRIKWGRGGDAGRGKADRIKGHLKGLMEA